MRYFTKELWSRLNDCDENIRIKAEKEWNANSVAYQQQFVKTKEHLSRGFVKDYLSRNGLHDYFILGIEVTKKGRTYCCQLQLSNGSETALLVMTDINKLKIDIVSFLHCIQRKLSWGYGEFGITPEKTITLSILCDEQNEMQFEFKSIKFIIQ